MRQIIVATDFSETPGSRLKSEGESSGEAFREEVLMDALSEAYDSNTSFELILDGTFGYPFPFLEEAFGGLIKNQICSLEFFYGACNLVSSEEPYLLTQIREIMKYEKEKLENKNCLAVKKQI